MIKLICSCALLLLITSCSAEKINLSPVSRSLTESSDISSYKVSDRKDLIVYSSEITNLISSFPKFKNDAVNSEVKILKSSLTEYIDAMETYNMTALFQSQRKFEKSYRKLQKLRKFLNSDEDGVLSRYLVRIKTNISQLDNLIPKDSLSTTQK